MAGYLAYKGTPRAQPAAAFRHMFENPLLVHLPIVWTDYVPLGYPLNIEINLNMLQQSLSFKSIQGMQVNAVTMQKDWLVTFPDTLWIAQGGRTTFNVTHYQNLVVTNGLIILVNSLYTAAAPPTVGERMDLYLTNFPLSPLIYGDA